MHLIPDYLPPVALMLVGCYAFFRTPLSDPEAITTPGIRADLAVTATIAWICAAILVALLWNSYAQLLGCPPQIEAPSICGSQRPSEGWTGMMIYLLGALILMSILGWALPRRKQKA